MSELAFDLARNCSQTALLYNSLSLGSGDTLSLLRALLPPASDISDAILQEQLKNDTFTRYLRLTAGDQCRTQICTSLNFPGNADIAGIGAIFAYATIAILATFAFALSEGCIEKWIPERLHVDSSVMSNFFEGIVFFQLMTQIATWAYLPRMKTLYELSVALLVTRLVSCATNLAATAYSFDDMSMPSTLCTWILGMLGSLAAGVFSFCVSWYAARFSFVDSACNQIYILPLRLIEVSASIHILCVLLLLWGAFLSVFNYLRISKFFESHGFHRLTDDSTADWFFWPELIVLWFSFALILVIRQRAQGVFGATYQDNAMGFGQIMSLGFCLQIFVQIVESVVNKTRAKRKEAKAGLNASTNAPAGSSGSRSRSTSALVGDTADEPTGQDTGSGFLEGSALSPQRSRTSNMEDGLSPMNSQQSIPLHAMSQTTAATSHDIDPPSTTLQKRPTFTS